MSERNTNAESGTHSFSRRRLLRIGGATAASAVGVSLGAGAAGASDRDWQGNDSGSDYGSCAYGRSCAGYDGSYPHIDGYDKSGAKQRAEICDFGSSVVFPVLTAVSLEDGVPISTQVVAKSWAAFSSGCYVIKNLDEAHGRQVDEAALYIDNDRGNSILQPPE